MEGKLSRIGSFLEDVSRKQSEPSTVGAGVRTGAAGLLKPRGPFSVLCNQCSLFNIQGAEEKALTLLSPLPSTDFVFPQACSIEATCSFLSTTPSPSCGMCHMACALSAFRSSQITCLQSFLCTTPALHFLPPCSAFPPKHLTPSIIYWHFHSYLICLSPPECDLYKDWGLCLPCSCCVLSV